MIPLKLSGPLTILWVRLSPTDPNLSSDVTVVQRVTTIYDRQMSLQFWILSSVISRPLYMVGLSLFLSLQVLRHPYQCERLWFTVLSIRIRNYVSINLYMVRFSTD